MIFPLAILNGFLFITVMEGIKLEGEFNTKDDIPDLYDDIQDVHLIPTSSFQREQKLPPNFSIGGGFLPNGLTPRIDQDVTPYLDSTGNMMPNYLNFINDLTYPYPYLNYDESPESFLKDEAKYLHSGMLKQVNTKRRLPLPLGPLMGFPLKSRPGTASRSLSFAGIGKGVQRRSNRRPTACSYGTFGLVCWNASLRKNRVQGGNFEVTP